jgi:hypothetical protein
MNDEVKELAEMLDTWRDTIERHASATTPKEMAQTLSSKGYQKYKTLDDAERREKIAKTIWEDECERNAPSSPDEWDALPEWAHLIYLELADQILALFPKPELLTDEEINKAFDSAFDKGVYFDHKPTVEEILTIRLRAVAQAQLAKNNPPKHMNCKWADDCDKCPRPDCDYVRKQ